MVEPHVGEIYAVREFRLTRDGDLVSLNSPTVWGQGEHQAVCHLARPSSHTAPAEDCRCGFYAYTTAEPAPDPTAIMAVVACYGRVFEGELGVRAEKARVVALCFGEAVPWKAYGQARNRFRDVEVFDDYTTMLAEFGIKPGTRRAPKTGEGIVFPAHKPGSSRKDGQTRTPRPPAPQVSQHAAQEALQVLVKVLGAGAELLSSTIRVVVVTAFLAFAVGLSIPQSAPYLLQEPWSSWAPVAAVIAIAACAPMPRWESPLRVFLQMLFISALVGTLILIAQSVTAAGGRGSGVVIAWLAALLVVGLDRGPGLRNLRFWAKGGRAEVHGSVVPTDVAQAGAVVLTGAGRGISHSGATSSFVSSRPFRFALLPSRTQWREDDSQ